MESFDGQLERLSALGVFNAVMTRDAVAQARDGWPYFQENLRGMGSNGELLYEIRFGDGEWMLAVGDDLTPNRL